MSEVNNRSGEKNSPQSQMPIKPEQSESFKKTLEDSGIKHHEFFEDKQVFLSSDKKADIKAKIEKLFKEKKPIYVIATKEDGDYPSRVRRQLGEKFQIEKPIHFSFNWMNLAE